jgi:hypothetical protein
MQKWANVALASFAQVHIISVKEVKLQKKTILCEKEND